MATYYFVSGSTWNSSANWSSTSGGTGGAGVPGISDTARLDANSPKTLNLDIDVSVFSLDATNWGGASPYAGITKFYFNGHTLTVRGYGATALYMPGYTVTSAPGAPATSSNIYLTNSTTNASTVFWAALSYDLDVGHNLICTSGNYALTLNNGIYNNIDFWGGGTSTYSGVVTLYEASFYGQLSLNTVASGMTLTSGFHECYAIGTNSKILTNGQSITCSIYVITYYQPNPSLTLLDAYTTNQAMAQYEGVLNLNGKNFTAPSLTTSAGVAFGSGTPTMTMQGAVFSSGFFCTGQGTTQLSLTHASSPTTLTVSATANTLPITVNQAGSTALTISGGAYLNIKNSAYGTVKFTGPVRFVDVNLKGTSGTQLVVQGTAANTSVRKVDPWYVGSGSTDAGGNTGIIFSGNDGSNYLTISNISGTYDYGPHFMMLM